MARRLKRWSRGFGRSLRRLRRSGRRLGRSTRRWYRRLRAAPPAVQAVVGAAVLLTVWAAVNWTYQAFHKPTELFFPVSGALAKTPDETWDAYGSLFTRHSTDVITPAFLAALAQVEASGNPVARTYWSWRPALNPLEIYRPASSAVGMYQITDATFREARRYCIHDHVAVEDGPWLDPDSCWFNALYTRVVPSHAIEMTSAMLDRQVALTLQGRRTAPATVDRQQDLAAVIHLCGPAAGETFAARGFRADALKRCGDHDVGAYLGRLRALKRRFALLAAGP